MGARIRDRVGVVAAVKGTYIMAASYAGMLGVPLLLWILSIISPFHPPASARDVLLFLIAIGSIAFGAVGLRDAYIHGSRRVRNRE